MLVCNILNRNKHYWLEDLGCINEKRALNCNESVWFFGSNRSKHLEGIHLKLESCL